MHPDSEISAFHLKLVVALTILLLARLFLQALRQVTESRMALKVDSRDAVSGVRMEWCGAGGEACEDDNNVQS